MKLGPIEQIKLPRTARTLLLAAPYGPRDDEVVEVVFSLHHVHVVVAAPPGRHRRVPAEGAAQMQQPQQEGHLIS